MLIQVKYDKPTKLACLQSIYVSFPYRQDIIEIIREIPERFWDAKNKRWELPFNSLSYLHENLPKDEFNIEGEPVDDTKFGDKHIKEYDIPKSIKTQLYDYQKDTYNEGMTYNKYLYLLEPGLGKAQPLYSKLLTPKGYINMGDVKIGDEVFGEDGKPHKVLGIFPQGKKDVYEITFSDGSKCRCSDEHLWEVRIQKTTHILTVKELLERGLSRLYFNNKHNRYFNKWKFKIPITQPLVFDSKEVFIDPWLFGVILGDGCISTGSVNITNMESDIIERIKLLVNDGDYILRQKHNKTYSIIKKFPPKTNKYIAYLRKLGLMGDKSEEKFIPDIYKYNDMSVRLSVLQGLFCTDGYVFKDYLSYSTSSKQLAEDIMFLVQSLGGTCSCNEHETFYTYKGEKKQGLNNFELVMKLPNDNDLIWSQKQQKQFTGNRHTWVYRTIRNIEYIGQEDCQCIYVDNPSHLYLTDNMIVTHNTLISITTVVKRYELGQIKRCLIIAGVNGLKYTWQHEFEKHSSYHAKILGNRQNKKGIWEVKGNKDKLDDLENLTEEDIFLVTNVETLRDKTIFEKLKKMCDKKEINCIVFDECHKCASVSSQQGKALLRLVKNIEYFYGLTGTIIMNKPLDTYVPLKCVGKEIANFTQFKSRYCVWGGFGGYEIVGYKNLSELQNKLYAVSKRLRKKDVLSLPPKVYVDEYVEMGAKQKKVYNDIQNIIMANLDKISVAIDPLAQLIRLRQATATTSIISSSVNESAKFSRAKEMVDELVADNKSVLVFSNWSKVIDSFEEYLRKDYKVAKITGDVKYREKEIELFNSKDCNIMIGTIGALGTGYTLTKATTVIFLDEPWTNAAKEQAEDRCYRIGTNESVNIITIMVKNTIDEYVHRIVKKKGYLSDALVDSKFDLKNENVLRFLVTGEGEI